MPPRDLLLRELASYERWREPGTILSPAARVTFMAAPPGTRIHPRTGKVVLPTGRVTDVRSYAAHALRISRNTGWLRRAPVRV